MNSSLLPTPSQTWGEARQCLVDNGTITFYLQRSKRRSISLLIKQQQLFVKAPLWLSHSEVERLIRQKQDWISRKQQQAMQTVLPYAVFSNGGYLTLIGQRIAVCTQDNSNTPHLDEARQIFLLPESLSQPALSTTQNPHPVNDLRHYPKPIQTWLRHYALNLLQARVAYWQSKVGNGSKTVHRITLSNAQTRWGSCSSNGSVRFSWRLIHFPLATIDYVVIHELAHLYEMNHSPAFWQIVATTMPDWHNHKAALK